ncbi:MAG: DUF4340 domain-containing protein [Kiritimatiellaeota bacterium]|nr:DUF4340 domain-containing protein [Kiritimatiellota bacterium]
MQLKTTLVLLLIVLGLGAYVFWVDRRADTTRMREEQARKALTIEPGRITEFTVASSNLQVTCVQTNGQWRLTRPIAARADAAAVDRLLAGLERLSRGEVITPAQRRAGNLTLASYGLEPARIRITLGAGARRQTVLFGRAAPLGGALYIKDAARAEVIATDASATNLCPASVAALRDHALFKDSAQTVKRFDLRGGGRFLQLARNDHGDWQFQQPLVARADRAAVQEVLELLFDWKAVDFVSDNPADLAPYGLDESATRVVLNAGDKTGEQTLLLGKHTSTNAPWVFAALPPEKAVVTVGVEPLVKLMLKLDELRDRRLLTLPANDVGGIRLQQGGRTLALKKDAGGWSLQQPRQARADSQRVQDFLGSMTGARIEAFLDAAATNLTALGLTEPEWKLTLQRAPPDGAPVAGAVAKAGAPGEDQQMLLVSAAPRAGGRRVVKLEHEATPYEVAGSLLTNLTVDPLVFRSREILNLSSGDLLKLLRVRPGQTQAVERATATNDFLAVTPEKGAVQPDAVNRIVQAVSRLTAVRLVADEAGDPAKYGLAQPALTLILGLKTEAGLAKSRLIGVPTEGGCFAMGRGQDLVFVLDPDVIALLGRDWFQPAVPLSPAEQKEMPGAPAKEPRPAAGGGRPARLRRILSRCGRVLHRLVVLVQWSVLAGLLTVVWLSLYGVPRGWVEPGLERLRARGLRLTVERVRLDIFNGVALDDVAVFETPTAGRPALRAERITLAFDPRAWWRRELGLTAITVRQGRLALDLGATGRGAAEALNISLDLPSAYVRVEPEGVRLVRCRAEVFGMRWRGAGWVHRKPAPHATPARPPPDLQAALAQIHHPPPAWLRRALEELRALAVTQPPQGDFEFDVWPDQPASNKVHLAVAGQETRCRGVALTRWQVEVNGHGPAWSGRGWVVQGMKQAEMNGTFNSATLQVQGRLTSSLPATALRSLAPAAVRAAYDRSGVAVRGALSFEVNAGPASVPQVLDTLRGWVSAREVAARGVALPSVQAVFRREGPQLALTEIKAVIGRDRQRGGLEGRCTVDLTTRRFQGEVRTSFDPHALAPLLSADEANLLSQVTFSGPPPETELSFSGPSSAAAPLRLSGRVAVRDFSFRGVPVVSARAKLTMSDSVLDLQDAFVVREEGCSRGRAVINFEDNLLDLDAEGTAEPQAVAQMIGEDFARFLRHFEFREPLHAVVCGRLDIGPTMGANRLRVSAQGARLGWRKLLAEHAAFDLLLDGPSLVVTNVAGVIYEGPFAGAAVFGNIASATQCAYEVNAVATNANFALLVQALGSGRIQTNQAYTGRLSAQARVAGVIGPDLAASTTGQGWVHIKEGQFFRIPLFGGLAQMLGKIIPGLGYLSQTELTSSFTLRDQKAHTEDLRIKGSMLSLSSHGAYGFSGELDFQLQVQLLREGLTAELLRLLTFPVTKLLEFRLIGTLAQPRWRPLNLPKEVFLQFD